MDASTQTALVDALQAMRTWLGVVANHLDLDPDDTRVTITAIGPNGKRELAARSLADILAQADVALVLATPARPDREVTE